MGGTCSLCMITVLMGASVPFLISRGLHAKKWDISEAAPNQVCTPSFY